jgi:hypothetical protein
MFWVDDVEGEDTPADALGAGELPLAVPVVVPVDVAVAVPVDAPVVEPADVPDVLGFVPDGSSGWASRSVIVPALTLSTTPSNVTAALLPAEPPDEEAALGEADVLEAAGTFMPQPVSVRRSKPVQSESVTNLNFIIIVRFFGFRSNMIESIS